jgi:alanine or glycine:cation symporter, AGCS family
MDAVAKFIIDAAEQIVPWMLGTLLAVGVFLTIRLRFVQVLRFPEAVRSMTARSQAGASGALAPFQAFMTALAGSIGTGNIAGVATAIVKGGPGALFWIWVYGFLAMAIKFAEASLGLHYRVARGEQVLSGPMYYLRDGLKAPWLAWLFALIAGVACLFTTPFTQPNSVALVINSEFGVPKLAVGIVLAILTWLVIVRGVKSIGAAAEMLSPLKVGLYLTGGAVVIGSHITRLPEVLALVVREAFSTQAASGALFGLAMMNALRYGVARGVYANEAGYGTAAVAYGTAKSSHPEQQGLNAVMEAFIISFITSSISALAILLTDVWTSGATSSAAVAQAFNASMPTVGGWMVAVSVFLFGYTTLIGWSYYGEQFLEYLFGVRIVMPYRWVFCLLIPLGAVAEVEVVWAWGDVLNGLQIFPNVIGLVGLSGVAAGYARTRRTPADL